MCAAAHMKGRRRRMLQRLTVCMHAVSASIVYVHVQVAAPAVRKYTHENALTRRDLEVTACDEGHDVSRRDLKVTTCECT